MAVNLGGYFKKGFTSFDQTMYREASMPGHFSPIPLASQGYSDNFGQEASLKDHKKPNVFSLQIHRSKIWLLSA